MKEIPILFSTMMVQANMEDRKGMTRRLVKWPKVPGWHNWDYEPDSVQRPKDGAWWPWFNHRNSSKDITGPLKCPYGQPGDVLWVREMLYQNGELGLQYVAYKEWIDEKIIPTTHRPYRNYAFCNIPGIHMPKWAARIWLQVTDVRVEKLQDISEEDAISEGVEKRPGSDSSTRFDYKHYKYGTYDVSAQVSFRTLWEKINGTESWKANPWLWVIKYKILSKKGKPEADWAPSHDLVTSSTSANVQ